MKVSIIVAYDENRLIGRNNQLPWHLPADLKHFRNITMGHFMVMGRKTFDSIGKPLPGRTSIIVTRQKNLVIEGCIVVNTLQEAINKSIGQDEIFIIGGAQIFNSTLPIATNLYVTIIHHQFEGDTHFPEIPKKEWQEVSREDFKTDEKNKWDFSYVKYVRKNF